MKFIAIHAYACVACEASLGSETLGGSETFKIGPPRPCCSRYSNSSIVEDIRRVFAVLEMTDSSFSIWIVLKLFEDLE